MRQICPFVEFPNLYDPVVPHLININQIMSIEKQGADKCIFCMTSCSEGEVFTLHVRMTREEALMKIQDIYDDENI